MARSESRLLRLLARISREVASDRPLAGILKSIARDIATQFRANTCSLMLLDETHRDLVFSETVGLTRWETAHIRFHLGEGVAGWVALHRKPANVADVLRDARFKKFEKQKSRIASMLCAPIVHQRRVLGVVTVTRPKRGAFSDVEVRLLEHLCAHLALEIENHRLYELAVTDGLTGLFNRRYFERRLADEISHSKRFKEPLAVAIGDVDYFKRVNDRHGHTGGDEVLVSVAHTIRGQLRGYDVAARLGGDEFALILTNTSRETASLVAERIRRALERDHAISTGTTVRLTASLGMAVFPEDATESKALLKCADEALYKAKKSGRNRVCT